jgi:hypothetical protein
MLETAESMVEYLESWEARVQSIGEKLGIPNGWSCSGAGLPWQPLTQAH